MINSALASSLGPLYLSNWELNFTFAIIGLLGASKELFEAVLVNPFDKNAMAWVFKSSQDNMGICARKILLLNIIKI